jgi:hypothetical protein
MEYLLEVWAPCADCAGSGWINRPTGAYPHPHRCLCSTFYQDNDDRKYTGYRRTLIPLAQALAAVRAEVA